MITFYPYKDIKKIGFPICSRTFAIKVFESPKEASVGRITKKKMKELGPIT